MSDQENLFIRYRVRLEDGFEALFEIELDFETLGLVHESDVSNAPEWARLGFHQCPNCPLSETTHPHCPVALNLTDLIEFLAPLTSYEQVEVTVETPRRTISATTSLEAVAGSLMGIYMCTSGCPVLDRLRPMVETHLPFASWRETCYRALTMYLFVQYFRARGGQEPRWDLSGLTEMYAEVQRVNQAFADRLKHTTEAGGDASPNAINILSGLASMTALVIESDDLDRWQRIVERAWT